MSPQSLQYILCAVESTFDNNEIRIAEATIKDYYDKQDGVVQVFIEEIYGDGKLLFKSENFSKNKMPNEFKVNITGVDVITIKFIGNRIGDWVLGDAWTGFAISDFTATKNLP